MPHRFCVVSFVFGIAMLGTACDPYVRTTVVELRDPSNVHYTTTLGQPISHDRKSAVISDDDVRYQGNHISEMIVTGEREPDGTLKTAWQTDPAIGHSDRPITFRPTSTTVIPGDDAVTMSADTLSFPVCGSYHVAGSRRYDGATRTLTPDCYSARNDFRVNAITSMSNVKSVRNVYEADRGRTVMTAVVVSFLAGGAASVLLLSKNGEPSSAAKAGAGVVLAVGGAIDVGLILATIFAHDHEDMLYEGAP